MEWTEGRQGTGYHKLKIFRSERWRMDCWLLRYRKSSFISTHTDPVKDGWKHYRLNICLKRAKGGNFYAWHKELWHWPFQRIILFRPDITPHLVEAVSSGTRYVLSIGWLRKEGEDEVH